jgi:hypothetical protein
MVGRDYKNIITSFDLIILTNYEDTINTKLLDKKSEPKVDSSRAENFPKLKSMVAIKNGICFH